jgi:ABC-type cobalamin/Fe3+-siderophores transport system ATPase subunit
MATAEIPRAHLQKVIFASGEKVSLKRDSILVFVGPNNAGKSTALAEISSLLNSKTDTKLIKISQARV